MQAQPVARPIEHLEPRKAHDDDIPRLHIAERQREEVLALGFHERHAPSRGFLSPVNLPRGLLFLHLRANDAAIDMHLTAIHRGTRW